jgi:hypothetical protein
MADGVVTDKAKKGALQLQIHLAGKDKNHIKLFHDAIGSKNKICECKDGSVRSSHSSDIMCGDLINHGCHPRKSLNLKFPSDIPVYLVPHFVRGYFDGDGSAFIVGKRLFLDFKGTQDFLEEIKFFLKKTSKKLSQRKSVWQLQIGGAKDCLRIANWMYEDDAISLYRKKEIIHKWIISRGE